MSDIFEAVEVLRGELRNSPQHVRVGHEDMLARNILEALNAAGFSVRRNYRRFDEIPVGAKFEDGLGRIRTKTDKGTAR